ncbi:MAG: diguanylate cyclase [Candidatus Omnitrophica bacterium]|nr:diguanylate cyclase [Candidatus Omnitrophota bacterium]
MEENNSDKECILVVDDDHDFRKTIVRVLKKNGYDINQAEDGLQAVELIKSKSFALIISDVRLPGLDGIGVMSSLIEKIQKTGDITKTMIITGYSDKDVPIRAIKLGVDDFLHKPFTIEVLRDTVEKLIKGYRLENDVEYYKNLSILDGLTGAFNHRYFHKIMFREIARAARYNHPLSILMIDLDDFKKCNDTYEHLSGDRILKGVVRVMKDSVRENAGLIFRYGGEKFAVILPEINKNAALEYAERIRMLISKTDFQCDSGAINVTISTGVATFPDAGETKDDLIQKAGAALCKAKESGKNCIYSF